MPEYMLLFFSGTFPVSLLLLKEKQADNVQLFLNPPGRSAGMFYSFSVLSYKIKVFTHWL